MVVAVVASVVEFCDTAIRIWFMYPKGYEEAEIRAELQINSKRERSYNNKNGRNNRTLDGSPSLLLLPDVPVFLFLVHLITSYIYETCKHYLLIAYCKLCSFSASPRATYHPFAFTQACYFSCTSGQDSKHRDWLAVAFWTTHDCSSSDVLASDTSSCLSRYFEHANVLAGSAEIKCFIYFCLVCTKFSSRNPAGAMIMHVQNFGANGNKLILLIHSCFTGENCVPRGFTTCPYPFY